jgi:hypothetical protein
MVNTFGPKGFSTDSACPPDALADIGPLLRDAIDRDLLSVSRHVAFKVSGRRVWCENDA